MLFDVALSSGVISEDSAENEHETATRGTCVGRWVSEEMHLPGKVLAVGYRGQPLENASNLCETWTRGVNWTCHAPVDTQRP